MRSRCRCECRGGKPTCTITAANEVINTVLFMISSRLHVMAMSHLKQRHLADDLLGDSQPSQTLKHSESLT
ncbi:hypothetical protein REJC140_01536 [Pseudorhizobium endolithicum]|uniref:Uncharacterized protein n=1 Tax=Pseudorhizobium endolithicum TaxID=1191678 RepID=A0ABM8PUW6_9HYPH|nr:hypothetical protein REJC140_01536 [Pseudorhizobium endolithicum]